MKDDYKKSIPISLYTNRVKLLKDKYPELKQNLSAEVERLIDLHYPLDDEDMLDKEIKEVYLKMIESTRKIKEWTAKNEYYNKRYDQLIEERKKRTEEL